MLTAYKRVALKVHPDKGGTNEDFQKLQAAKENWERANTNSAPPGRPQPATADLVVNTGSDSAKLRLERSTECELPQSF